MNIAGQYSGKLDNGGESLVLELQIPMMWQFYDFPTTINGLQMMGTVHLDRFAYRSGQFLSGASSLAERHISGSPDGKSISDSYNQWATRENIENAEADLDDGINNLLEYAFNTDPRVLMRFLCPKVLIEGMRQE